MMRLVRLLLDAPVSEHAPAFQDAAWTLLGRALTVLQSADTVDGRQTVCTESATMTIMWTLQHMWQAQS